MPAPRPRPLVVVSLLVTLLLTACSGSDQPNGDQPKAQPAENSPSASASPSATPETPTTPTTTPAPATPAPPPPQPRFGAAKPGQCHRMTAAQSRSPITSDRKVACRREHTTTVAYVGLVRRAVTTRTPLTRRRALAARVCEPAFRRVVGGDPAVRATSILTWTFFVPRESQLERGARWVRCDVLARSGRSLVPLPAARPLLRDGLPEPLRVCQTPRGADVSCASPHAFRVAGVFQPPGNAYPGPEFTTQARDRCEAMIGAPGGYWQPPSRPGWARGDRFVRCLTRSG